MAISKDNVKSNFMELSGLDSTSAEVYAGLITVCADEMEKAVDQERMVAEGGTAICEFAAAAEVFYRFICLKAAEYKVMFTAQGKADPCSLQRRCAPVHGPDPHRRAAEGGRF